MCQLILTKSDQPNTLLKAMRLGWTQNIIIFEADLTAAEREWYVNAACKFGWSKLVLVQKITEKAHLNTTTQEPTATKAPDNHIISNNTVNLGVYFGSIHDLQDTADSILRKNVFPRTRRLDLQQVAYLWYPNIKEGAVRMPIIRPIEGLHDAEQISKLCWQKNDSAFLTKDGCAYLVVMSMETYEQQMKVLDIYSKLMVAEKQNDEGAPLLDKICQRLRKAYEL